MIAGDAIWYRQTCRGGYGYQRDVPGVLVKLGERRWTIEITKMNGDHKQIRVAPSNVRPRE